MSEISNARLDLLEQRVTVMQNEFNAVLGDIHIALQGMTRATKMALEVLDERLAKLELETSSRVSITATSAPQRLPEDEK